MTATNHTEHYNLSQYTEDDHPTYTGDYNGDMSKIDAAIYAASQSGGGGMATVEHTADLTGDGSADNPLGVADTIARTEDIPSLDGYATTESVTQAIATAIADRLTAGDIKSGNGINIETSGNTVTISYVGGGSSGGLSAVAHDDTLTGDGTSGSPLGAAATIARTEDIPSLDGYATTQNVSQAIANAIADRLTALNIKAGNAISVSTSGNDVTISYTGGSTGGGGLAAVTHDSTLLGDGTTSSPLKMAKGTILTLNAVDVNSPSSPARDMDDFGEGFTRVVGLKEKLLNTPDVSYVNGRHVSALVKTVTVGSGVKIQTWITAKTSNMKIHMRGYNEPNWTKWVTIEPLSQSAPSATGLTAEQLDTQYSDDYNIVRVGTPTQLNESEVNPNE